MTGNLYFHTRVVKVIRPPPISQKLTLESDANIYDVRH